MKTKRTISSFFMVFIYVFSFAHGSLPHSSCDNHKTRTLHQVPHSDHGHDDVDTAYHSHGIIHSLVHLIEHLAHNQYDHDEPLSVEVNGYNFYYTDVVFTLNLSENKIISTVDKEHNFVSDWYSAFYLLLTPLRGPPISA